MGGGNDGDSSDLADLLYRAGFQIRFHLNPGSRFWFQLSLVSVPSVHVRHSAVPVPVPILVLEPVPKP